MGTRISFVGLLACASVMVGGCDHSGDFPPDAFGKLLDADTVVGDLVVGSLDMGVVDMTPGVDFGLGRDLVAAGDILVVNSGRLEVSTDPNTPPDDICLMGEKKQKTGKFVLRADNVEDIIVSQIIMSGWFSGQDVDRLMTNNVLVDDNGSPISQPAQVYTKAINGVDPNTPQFLHVVFSGLSIVVPRNGRVGFGIADDHLSFKDGGFVTTGQMFIPGILAAPGNSVAVTALGKSSNVAIIPTVVSSKNPPGNVAGAFGNPCTFYRAKLVPSWTNGTPSGPQSPQRSQIIALWEVRAFSNDLGNPLPSIEVANVDIDTDIGPVAADREMTMATDPFNLPPYDSFTYLKGMRLQGRSGFMPRFGGVPIGLQMPRPFKTRLDTDDAATHRITIWFGLGSIQWSDGISKGITKMPAGALPLTPQVLHY